MDLVWIHSSVPNSTAGSPTRLHSPNEVHLTVYSANPITRSNDEVMICAWQPAALPAPNAPPQIYVVRTRSCDPLETGYVAARPQTSAFSPARTKFSVFQSIEIAQTVLRLARFIGFDVVVQGIWRNGQLRVSQWQPLAWQRHEAYLSSELAERNLLG